ncbi:NAD(P)/FAD-dependent oxidoreductase [Streptomyces sp. NBC_01236]|uniref:NAD(P)/FAD-dependent oxidoreductase n=1 Tax=Streptomyces sp. NBC_01236 TaxID=2903789 RepID=UPI002E13F03B|nr:FAD-dependent oxidoreductase [Streptomyces sp. NBC_01236]
MTSTATDRIAVVGTGLAGLSAAERLRELGWRGEITMIGDEPHRPYNRTPLSKQLLTGDRQPPDLALTTHTELNASWRLGTRALGLDVHRRALLLPGGEQLPFDGLVIAPGVEARHLPGTPLHSERVWMLRTLADARHIDAALARARHVAVIGGGFIGCEVACTARTRALDVTLIDVSPTPLHRALGPALGAVIADLHRDHGVRLHLGVGVHGWHEDEHGVRVLLDDGETVRADAAVVGVGTMPRTDWLWQSGLDLTDGVLCAPTTHVIGADGYPIDGLVAAGDVARWPNLRFDDVPRRVEHWINAIEMGRHAADALLQGPETAVPFAPVPRFWSHQHGVRIQSVGMPGLGTDMNILHGDPTTRRTVAGYTRPGPDGTPVLVGAVALDSPRTLLAYRNLIGHPLATLPGRRRAA